MYLCEIDSVECGCSSPKNLPDSHLGVAGHFLVSMLVKDNKIDCLKQLFSNFFDYKHPICVGVCLQKQRYSPMGEVQDVFSCLLWLSVREEIIIIVFVVGF